MARRHISHGGGFRSTLHHATHAFPGMHYTVIRPARDDLRRSVVDVPRRSRRVRNRQQRERRRKLERKGTKELMRDTHKGRAANTKPGKGGRAPTTMKARQPGSEKIPRGHVRTGHKTAQSTGVKAHRPRVLSPHHPRWYHVIPVRVFRG